jgi:hypothetical protein
MKILKGTGRDWRKTILISKLYMDRSGKVRLDQVETRSVKTGRGVRQGCCLSLRLFNVYSQCLTKETLEGFEDFKRGGHVIRTTKYVLAEKDTALQGMTDRPIEIGDATEWK